MNYFWNRLFARLFDYGLFYLLGIAFSMVSPFEFEVASYLLFAALVPLLFAPFEAFLIRLFGTTPGKMLFGIKIPSLTLQESFARALFLGKRPGQLQCASIGKWRYLLTIALALSCGSTLFFGKDISEAALHLEQKMIGGQWIEYTSDEGHFTVQFPKKPKLETIEFPIPNSDNSLSMSEYKAEGEAVYSVSHLDLPKKWMLFTPGILLKGAMNVVVEHMPGAKLKTTQRVTHKNYPALNFTLQEGEKEVQGRLILVGRTLYKLTVTYPPGVCPENQHEAFLDSFGLKSAED